MALFPSLNKSNAAVSDTPQAIPRHVAIVMDGNGRWAQRRGLPRTDGHAAGEEALMAQRYADARVAA